MIMAQLRYSMTGLAVHYDVDRHAGKLTRSGEPYRGDALTCAVDAGVYQDLAGSWLLVMADNGRWLPLRVNDSGYLTAAGCFAWSAEKGYYVPDPEGLPVMVDVPEQTFYRLSPDGETIAVWIFLLEHGNVRVPAL